MPSAAKFSEPMLTPSSRACVRRPPEPSGHAVYCGNCLMTIPTLLPRLEDAMPRVVPSPQHSPTTGVRVTCSDRKGGPRVLKALRQERKTLVGRKRAALRGTRCRIQRPCKISRTPRAPTVCWRCDLSKGLVQGEGCSCIAAVNVVTRQLRVGIQAKSKVFIHHRWRGN